jgi:hypothetical protein
MDINKAPYSSVLLFSENGSQFVNSYDGATAKDEANPHDFLIGVDVKIKDEYIKNGHDNYLPNHIINAVKRSTIQKRAYSTITGVACGSMNFVNVDGSPVAEKRLVQLNELYKSIGLTMQNFLRPAMCSAYLFKAQPVTFSFGSDGRGFGLSNIAARDYKTFRLGRAEMLNGASSHERHYYHRNWGWKEQGKGKNIKVSEKKTKSWLEWQEDPTKFADDVAYINSYNPELSLSEEVNRTQSFLIKDMDGLTDFYPLPSWFSGAAFNYIQADFYLSCFDIDDIKNGFHAAGIVKVYHKSYKDPESGEAKKQFEEHKHIVAKKMMGGHRSGAVTVVPVGIDGEPGSDFMEFVPTPTNANKDRHTNLDSRIRKTILSANSAIYPELFGIAGDGNALSEGAGKLIAGLKILNQFTIKPLKAMFDDYDSGFLNLVNDLLEIPERTVIVPNLNAFLDIESVQAMHYLHPQQWYALYKDFGLQPPTEEQISSGLIPAYRQQNIITNGNA